MSFKVIDKNSFIDREFNSEPVSGDNNRYVKAKIKSYGDKINKNFQG